MIKGVIYYTDNQLIEPIFTICQRQILKTGLPIVSVSLSPITFGNNFVLPLKRGYVTMVKQIVLALEKLKSNTVFFCEHDCLYPPSHFEFIPPRNDIFYYNANVLRWDYPKNRLIKYDRLISLSGLCVNRKLALNHYKKRLKKIEDLKLEAVGKSEPSWARKWGYEPGTKKIKRGGFSDDDFETWQSREPIIDIRHDKTFSPRKVTLESFKHKPKNWQEIAINQIYGWNLRELFSI